MTRRFVAFLISIAVGVSGMSIAQTESSTDSLLKRFVSELVLISPGQGEFPKSFAMGTAAGDPSERPVHTVTFNYDFSIARFEVPQNLYQAVMNSNPSRWKGPRNSVEMITFEEANEFCRRMTKLLRDRELIKSGSEIRLPSEAEWEYCCRAGTTTEYSFGDSATKTGDTGKKASLLDEYAWHTGNAAGNDPPVGALKPNRWGLYDMHGYLWEFCSDAWYDDYKNAPSDGSARKSKAERKIVMRGGSWKDTAPKLRSAARASIEKKIRGDHIGIRCVMAKVKKTESIEKNGEPVSKKNPR